MLKSVFLAGAVIASVFTPGIAQAEERLFIGGYNSAIESYPYDLASGKAALDKKVETPALSASWLVYDKRRSLFLAVNELGSDSGIPQGQASAFKIVDPAKPLSFLGSVPTTSNEPTFASMSPDGRFMFTANYSVSAKPGGSLVVMPIAEDGSLGPVSQTFHWKASNVNPARQASSHIHQAIVSPDKKSLYVNDLGGDRIYQLRFEEKAKDGQALKAASELELPPGSGPRHIAFSADGKHAYLTLEMKGELAVLDVNSDGTLKLKSLVPMTIPGYSGNVGAGAIAATDDGKFLYVTNRGDINCVFIFKIDAASGDLTPVQVAPVSGREPRVFAIAPDGKHFLVANQFTNEVVVFTRDPDTGTIGKVVQRIPVSAPSMLVFVDSK